jgi:hypothetical protein
MAQVWPITLQQLLNESGFGITRGETVLRSDMDSGPAKTRRRFTKSVDSYTASIWVDETQYLTFENFYDTTLNGGTLPFTFPHPITQVPTDFRFKSPPKYSPVGGGTWSVSFEWEKLP